MKTKLGEKVRGIVDKLSGTVRYDSAKEPGSRPAMDKRKDASMKPYIGSLKAGPATSAKTNVIKRMAK